MVRMVILDAISKGHINATQMMEYMKTQAFFDAVALYKQLYHETF